MSDILSVGGEERFLVVKLQPIIQTSLVDQVAGRLRLFIDEGKLKANDRLPSEPELVERLQVSRTVLREAISRLESIGLLKVRRGLGTFVGDRTGLSITTQLIRSAMSISTRDLKQVAQFRRDMECPCARRAAERANDEQIRELELLLSEMANNKADLKLKMRFDFDFHLKIIEIGGNELMRNVLEVLQEFVFAAMIQTLDQPGIPNPSKDQHLEILDAIRTHDADRAEKAASAHMDLLDARLEFISLMPKEKMEKAITKASTTQNLKNSKSIITKRK